MVSKPKYVNVIYMCIVVHSILLISVPWPYPFTAAVAENFLTVIFVIDQVISKPQFHTISYLVVYLPPSIFINFWSLPPSTLIYFWSGCFPFSTLENNLCQ